jgi:hypothetical protein
MKTSTSVKTTITVNIAGQSFDLTPAEAKSLKDQLEAAMPGKTVELVPCPYPVPERPYPRPRNPWPDLIRRKDEQDFQKMFHEQPDFPPMTICRTSDAPPLANYRGAQCKQLH